MPVSQRSKPSIYKWLLLSLLVISIAAGAFLFWGGRPHVYYLSVYKDQSGEILYQREVEICDKVVLNYIHSADATPVSAVFEIRDGGLHLVEERYSWYGAGLESGADLQFSFQGNEVIVSGYERTFPELPIRVARTVPQELVFIDKNEFISLQQLAPGGTLLIVRVDKY